MTTDSPRILIVRSGALGDMLLTLPLVASIRIRHPDAAITFLGNRACKRLFPTGISCEPIDGQDWVWLFGNGSEKIPPPAGFFHRAYVILNRPEDVVRNLKRAGTADVRVASSTPRPGKHLVEHLHEELGLLTPEPEPCLSHLAASIKEDLFWLHPGSGGPQKCVPLTVLAELAEDLAVRTGWKLAVTAGEEDEFLRNSPQWADLVQSPHALFLDRKPLTELVAQLRGARLFIGNDSGIAHLATGLGIPSAVFFVSTDPDQWAPWVPKKQLLVLDCRATDSDRASWAGEILKLIR